MAEVCAGILSVVLLAVTFWALASRLEGCGVRVSEISNSVNTLDDPPADAVYMSFLAVGDWGGDDDEHPTTEAQWEVAAGMNEVAKRFKVDGVFMLGDNFYLMGVDTCRSPRFGTTFEDVYGSQDELKDLHFHVIAGNHDYYGTGNIQAQLDYNGSSRWQFPASHYVLSRKWTTPSGQRSLDVIFIDTVELVDMSDHDQWVWLEAQLKTSTADFLWVAGHYPVYSVGADGTVPQLVMHLLPMLQKYGAHYISGHDHMFQHLAIDDANMFVAGAGMECCYPNWNMHTVPDGALKFMVSGEAGRGPGIGARGYDGDIAGGFAALRFAAEFATVNFYTHDGSLLYTAPALPRRRRPASAGDTLAASASPTVV